MSKFDPEIAGFIKLHDFQFSGVVDVYEYRNHAVVDGDYDFLRLNVYLTKDGDFVTIWFGLLEPMAAEARFELPGALKNFNFYEAYNEPLFRGYIEGRDEGTTILNALRLPKSYGRPHVLSGAPHDLRCELLAPEADAK